MTQISAHPVPESISLDFKPDIQHLTQGFVGREWVFTEIDRWLADPNGPPFFIITGEPGIGKSAIAARLTQLRDDIGAYHFCLARRADTIDPLNMVRSLAQQLSRFEGFTRAILNESNIVVQPEIDVRENYGEVVGVRVNTLILNARSASSAFQQSLIEPLKVFASSLEHPLLIVVDSLDETAQYHGDETIVDLLANAGALPPQVRFVLTSRSEGEVLRHFVERNIKHIELDAKGEDNRLDVASYFDDQFAASAELRARVSESGLTREQFVERLIATGGGNFLYLVWLLPAIAAGRQSLAEHVQLPPGLDGIYREFLRTRTVGEDLRGRWRSLYRPLLGALAAARAPLDVAQLQHFAHLDEQTVADVVEDVRQFLDPIEATRERYTLYHQSLADFLCDKKRAEEFWIEIRLIHAQMANVYFEGGEGSWSKCDDYGLRYLPFHLKQSEQTQRLNDLLTNFDWLYAKLRNTELSAMLADYELTQAVDVRLVGDALSLSMHVLAQDKQQLAPQLLGRLLALGHHPSIKALLEQAKAWKGATWLRPLTASLDSPGGALVRTLAGHSDQVAAVALTPDGRFALSASHDKTIKVWDWKQGQEVRTLTGHSDRVTAVALTPDGRFALSASDDKTIKVWDWKQGQEVRTLTGHSEGVSAIALTPDGHYALSASKHTLGELEANTIKVWDWQQGREVGHSDRASASVETPDGRYVLAALSDKTIKVWNRKPGQGFRTEAELWQFFWWQRQEVLTRTLHSDVVNAVLVTPDERYVLTASLDDTIKVWDWQQAQEVRALAGHSARVSAIALTSDGRYALSASWDKTIKVWDWQQAQEVRTLKGHSEGGTAIVVTPDGRFALSASSDNTIKVWDWQRDQAEETLNNHSGAVTSIVVTSDGRYALSASSDKTIKVWDWRQGQEVRTLKGHSEGVTAIVVTPDGRFALSASDDNTIKVWDWQQGQEVRTLTGHSGFITTVAVMLDGRHALSASGDTTIKIWDWQQGQEVRTLAVYSDLLITNIALSPDGRYALLASSFDNTIKVWDLQQNQEVRTLTGHSIPVTGIVITPDGRYALSASRDQTIKVWDWQQGREVRTLTGHSEEKVGVGGIAVALTPDGHFAVSASDDKTIKIWDWQQGLLKESFMREWAIRAVAIADDNRTIIAGDEAGRMYFLRLEGLSV